MQLNRLSPVIIAVALSGCALEPESLNSERIEQRFGSYGIEVLTQNAGERRSNLYSLDGEQKICRTYAVVRFLDDAVPQVAETHADVLAGQSIGATFKSSGWVIGKVTLYIGSLRVDDLQQPLARLMQLDTAAEISVHVYQLVLEKDAQTIEYATIVEAHHPDYLNEQALLKLYGENYQAGLSNQEIRDISTLITNMD